MQVTQVRIATALAQVQLLLDLAYRVQRSLELMVEEGQQADANEGREPQDIAY